VWDEWDETIGLQHLKCLHLNDSKTPFASRRDRHELIGNGTLGVEPFRRIMEDPRFANTIKIIETPKGTDPVENDRRMLQLLRSLSHTDRSSSP
jgi:deoxyribonuclease-4